MADFNKNSIRTLEKRYLLKDETGKIIETPDQMLERTANTVCKDNNILKSKILEMMNDLRFLPNTPTLMNAGTTNMLSACFVINVDDSLESIIHDAGWWQAKIHQTGGGVGINLSKLRPKGDLIKSTSGITSGILGFLEVFNVLSEVIRQGGKRDGANMGLLSISHPEIESWITAKVDNNKFQNFNLSVLVTDKFMEAVESNTDWNLTFNNKIYKTIKAQYLFNLICNSAHSCGCPGIIFEDEINRNNPLSHIMWMKDTNPCGEQPLFVGYYNDELIAESCNLGSLNLSKYCIPHEKHNGFYMFDIEKYKEDIHNATEFLDLVIDVNKYPFDFITKGTKLTRKIGLGTTGLSECLIKLRMIYGSNESIKFIENIMSILRDESHIKSEELGKQKGFFPLSKEANIERRNLFTTTEAPNGTTGRFMAGHPYSSGIEPPPAIYMSSNIIDTKIDDGIHPLLIEMLYQLKKNNPEYNTLDIDNIIKKIKEDGKSIQHIKEIPKHIRKLFRVAEEISIEEHIAVQSTVQEYIDNAVSKTINIKEDATIEDVKKAYILAYKTKCKGVTVYRDNCKDSQVFETTKKEINILNTLELDDLPPRPPILGALSFTKKTACNTLFIHPTYLGVLDKTALESFISASGGCFAMRTGLAVSISVYQRILETIDPKFAQKSLNLVMTHLEAVPCQVCEKQIITEKFQTEKYEKYKKGEGEKVEKVKHPVDSKSCPAAVASAMRFMLEHKVETLIDGKSLYEKDENSKILIKLKSNNKKKCPQCRGELFKQEGCGNFTCVCGYGGCS
jgi:ribonucleoside-diphosphate reductase alpha chain